jgi:hypothetical protein
MTRQGKARQGKARQGKARQGKARQDKPKKRQDANNTKKKGYINCVSFRIPFRHIHFFDCCNVAGLSAQNQALNLLSVVTL